MLKEDFMLFNLEELYMLRINLKSYGKQFQSMFKNKQTNKINETKPKQNQKQMKKTQIIQHKKHDVHPGPSEELGCKYSGLNRVK